MPKRFVTLAWSAAAAAYLLVVLGAIVRITGSGLGCGDHWPLCNGHLVPPLGDIPTVIEWSHRLVAAVVSVLVLALGVLAWRGAGGLGRGARTAAYSAVVLLVVQVLLGAVTVKTGLTPVLVILHLATAMLLLATLIFAARPQLPTPGSWLPLSLAFITVLFGAATANLGAIASCGGFPLCSGQLIPTAGPLAWVQWIHRLLAYSLAGYLIWWMTRDPRRAQWLVVIVLLQITIAATMIGLGFPSGLQVAHAGVGAAVWAAVVVFSLSSNSPLPSTSPPEARGLSS